MLVNAEHLRGPDKIFLFFLTDLEECANTGPLLELLQPGAADGRGREEAAEGYNAVPPATLTEVKQCAMYYWYSMVGDQCENLPIEGKEFCAEHIDVKLCKTSGLTYQSEGNRWLIFLETIPPHPVDEYGEATKRKIFCSDRCRNLWRDTRNRREREVEVIENYQGSGEKAVMDKKTGRIIGSGRYSRLW